MPKSMWELSQDKYEAELLTRLVKIVDNHFKDPKIITIDLNIDGGVTIAGARTRHDQTGHGGDWVVDLIMFPVEQGYPRLLTYWHHSGQTAWVKGGRDRVQEVLAVLRRYMLLEDLSEV